MEDGIEEEDVFLLLESQELHPRNCRGLLRKDEVQRPEMETRGEEEGEEGPHSQTIPPIGKQSSLTN